MRKRQNIVTGLGETFILNLVYLDSTGSPVDLTGHSVSIEVRKPGNGEVVGTYEATVDNSGNITIKVADEVTDEWPVGRLSYLVKHTTPDGDERWLAYGALTVVNGWDS